MAEQTDLSVGPHVALVQQLRILKAQSGTATHEFLGRQRAAVEAGELAGAVLADAALYLLETLTVQDDWLDMAAAGILIDLGEARHLKPLRAVAPKLRPRVALRDWRLEVGRAIDVIAARDQSRCDCRAQASHGAPVHGSQWAVEKTAVDADQYCTEYTVRCVRCQRLWTVVEESGYHYPVFRWTEGH